MPTVITEFDAVTINNASIQFKDGVTYTPGTKFGCIGSIEGETEVLTRELRCGVDVLKSVTKPTRMTLTLSAANVPIQVARDVFGLKTDGLKVGVWSYGRSSKSKDFILTADVIDEFEDVVKMIAFPNSSNTAGFRIQTIENGAEEVANVEFEFTVLPDEAGEMYYEALVPELDDVTVAEQWHTAFTRTLVEAVPTP